ncbi:MAG: hypothetical protein JRG81_13075 [Deltaproteobacteria bacterium]|nr:hypothetical protein [Deltaproteobacteria bacterium]
MKKITAFISFIVIISCVASSERMRADDFYKKREYIKALKSYELALTQSTTDSQRSEIQQKIGETKVKIVDDSIQMAEIVYQKVDPPSLQSIEDAILVLKNAPTDDRLGRISSQIKKYQDIKKGIIKSEAERMKAKGEYFNALKTYEYAREIAPYDNEISYEISHLTIFIKKEKESGLREIEKLLKIGDGEKAKAVFDKLRLMDPEDEALEMLKGKISDARRKQVLSKALDDESQYKFFTAYKTLKGAKIDGLEKEIIRIGKEGSKYYFRKAEKYMNSGEVHLAYVASVKAMELSPGDIQISQINKNCADIIDNEIQKYIAIITFGSPANHPDYGTQFSDALITRLFKELPYGINIVEQEKVDLLENAQKMKIKNIGGSLGADIVINGNVSLFKVEEVKSESTATVKVKVGEEEVINPEYEKMLKTYGDDKKIWPSQPQRNIRKNTYEIVTYKKGKLSKSAFGNVSIRIFDASSGKLVFSENFADSLERIDKYQDSVEAAGILHDPLELPSETEIKSELRDKMASDISNAIVGLLQNREKRFWKSAALRMEQNEYQNAIKFLAQGYLFCHKSKMDNEYYRKLYNMMTALTEIN